MAEPQILYTIPRQQTRTHNIKPFFLTTITNKYIFKNYNIVFNPRPIKSISGLTVKHVYLYDTQWIITWYFMNYPDDDNVTFNINGSWHRQWPGEPYHLQLNIISQKYKIEFASPIHIVRLDNGTAKLINLSNPINLKNPLILEGMGLGWDINEKDATTGNQCDIFPVAGQYTGQNDYQDNPILIPDTPQGQQRSEASKYFYIPAVNFWPRFYKDERRPPAITVDPYLPVPYPNPNLNPAGNQGQGQGMKSYFKIKKPKSKKPKSKKPKSKNPKSKNPKSKKPKSKKLSFLK
jgi:hypothetical protein